MMPSTQQLLQLLPFSIIKKMGLWGEGMVREFGMDMYTLLYFKWIANRDLLYTTGNSVQCQSPVLDRKGVCTRMDRCVCMAGSLHCSPETTTTFLISYATIQKLKKKLDGPEWGTRGKDWELGIIRGKLLYIKWIHNKVRLYSMGNLYSISCNKP